MADNIPEANEKKKKNSKICNIIRKNNSQLEWEILILYAKRQ